MVIQRLKMKPDSDSDSNSAARRESRSAAELLPLVYDELRHLAAHRLAQEQHAHTLQPTALVHEAWLKLAGANEQTWQGRQHFYAAAAESMRRILVDRARRRHTVKRGGGMDAVELDESEIAAPLGDEMLLALNEALNRLAIDHAQKAELVKLRYFTGLSFSEAAEILGIAVPTAKEWWSYARAWLRLELKDYRAT